MKNKKLILALVALIVVVGVFAGVWFATRSQSVEGTKHFTVLVVHSDKAEETFTYSTDAEKLGDFLEAEGLINSEGADEGMFHTVDGEKADWNVDQSYWAFYVGDQYATTGIYDTVAQNGTTYKLVYTVGGF